VFTERRNVSELNSHGLLYEELTNGRTGPAHCTLVDE